MREGRASTTAMFVAWARGLGTGASAPDTFAHEVLPSPIAASLKAMQRWPTATAPLRWLARAASAGMVDHVNLRTAAIDSALQRGVDRGIDQLVVLGAGLDGRAWRLPWLRDVDVLELDHPDTQTFKRAQTTAMHPAARSLEFVPVDFERQRLGDRLDEGGHDRERSTFWIWEGVTPYLVPAAIEATLHDLASRSAPRSVLAMTYMQTGHLAALPGVRLAVGAAFGTIGEPLVGMTNADEVAGRLRRHAFEPVADTDQRDWGSGLEPTIAYPFRAERLVVARRTDR